MAQGTVQTNYFLHTTWGKYVFRVYENRSRESVLFETELLAFLKGRGYPCPVPFNNRQGNWVGETGGRPYVIFEFLDGQPVERPNEHQKRQIIQKAAELQTLARDYSPRYREFRWNYEPELCRRLARAEAHKIGTPEAQEKLAWLEGQLSALDLPAEFPKGICHCDFHFSNVLFQDDRFAGLIDFDDANYTYLVFDLVCLIETWAWPFPSDELDLAQARGVVQIYSQVRPLGEIEQQHLYDVHKLSILIDCVWYFGRGRASDFYEKRKIEFMNRLGRHKYTQAVFS